MDIFLCASVMFALQFPVLRLLGKCELAQVTPFELVVLIIMVDLIQQGVTHNDFSLTGATLAIGSFAFCGLVLSWMNSRFPRIGRRLEGEPRVIIRAGELVEDSLRRDRMTRAEVEYVWQALRICERWIGPFWNSKTKLVSSNVKKIATEEEKAEGFYNLPLIHAVSKSSYSDLSLGVVASVVVLP